MFCGTQTKGRSIPLGRPYLKQAAMFSPNPDNGHHMTRQLHQQGRRSWSRVNTPSKPPHHLPPGAGMSGLYAPAYVPYKSIRFAGRSKSTPPMIATMTVPPVIRKPSTDEVCLAARRTWTGDELEILVRDKIQEKTRSGNGQTLMALRLFGAGASANEQEITPLMFQQTLSKMLNTQVQEEESMRLFVKYDMDKGGTIDCGEFTEQLLPGPQPGRNPPHIGEAPRDMLKRAPVALHTTKTGWDKHRSAAFGT